MLRISGMTVPKVSVIPARECHPRAGGDLLRLGTIIL
jgi:hypothetical protein